MIPLTLAAETDAELPFVTRLRTGVGPVGGERDSVLFDEAGGFTTFTGPAGLLEIEGASGGDLNGDIVLINPAARRAERIFRSQSKHNTLLVTERCDQLCVMCSQPPKKTHHDRFDFFEEACLLAEPDALIGVSGGEPTLYKDRLLAMVERVLSERPDLSFHILSNAQHFDNRDIDRLRNPIYRRVTWGIPLYAVDDVLHDQIVGKDGAAKRLRDSFAVLILAGARVELRTVLLTTNAQQLPRLARYVAERLQFVQAWSIMQLENIGFAKNRWGALRVRHDQDFAPIAAALDLARARGVAAQLFNFPRCSVPDEYRDLALASISDWKTKFAPSCSSCAEQSRCSGFFEWHPDHEVLSMVKPL